MSYLVRQKDVWDIIAKLRSEFITIEQNQILEEIDEMIDALPTIDIEERLNEAYAHGWSDAEAKFHDAVKVVRCRECKHQHKCFRDAVIRTRNGVIHCPVVYCSCGEREKK